MSPSLSGGGSGVSGASVFSGSGAPTAPFYNSFFVSPTGSPNGSGTFKLQFRGQTTAPITFDATGSDVAAALALLSTIGEDNIAVYPGNETTAVNSGFTIIFPGDFGFEVAVEAPTVVDDTTDNGVIITDAGSVSLGVPAAAFSEGDEYYDWIAQTLYVLHLSAIPTWLPASAIFLPGKAPLPTAQVPGEPLIWSAAVNGWVQDAAMQLAVGYHSSGDAGDLLPAAPFQTLSQPWSTAAGSPMTNHFGYIDHLPADGHAGPILTSLPVTGADYGAQPFHITFNTNTVYGVIRLDRTASCVVTAKDHDIPDDLSGSTYNADSTLMDWAGAAITGTDLSADGTNNWIHSTAGGLVYIFSTLAFRARLDDGFDTFS